MENLIELSGHFVSNGTKVSFQVELRMPEQVAPFGDYQCQVTSPQLFTKCMNIYGVSRYQAIHLALTCITASLTSLVVTEQDLADDLAKQSGQDTASGQ